MCHVWCVHQVPTTHLIERGWGRGSRGRWWRGRNRHPVPLLAPLCVEGKLVTSLTHSLTHRSWENWNLEKQHISQQSFNNCEIITNPHQTPLLCCGQTPRGHQSQLVFHFLFCCWITISGSISYNLQFKCCSTAFPLIAFSLLLSPESFSGAESAFSSYECRQ